MPNTILVDNQNSITTITLNRPERLNAWTDEMSNELYDTISACNVDGDVGAIVITGAGRGFCAGADIKDSFQARMDGKQRTARGNWIELVRSSKPLIAAVNGACVGVGATMILPMDIIIASTNAKFGMAFVKMGVTPELASSHFLPKRIGWGKAHEMCLTGKLYSGSEAFEMGLADKLVDPDELLPTARELAEQISANPSPHLRWVKQLLSENATENDINEVQRREGEVLNQAYNSPEHKEAVSAFIEKREPVFKR